MLVTMANDEEFEANLMRDLCAISNFGILEEMLTDLRECHKPAQDSEESRTRPRKPRTPKHSRLRSRGYPVVIAPDYDQPVSMGRGAALDALEGAVIRCEEVDLRHELLEIESGSYRNESIEAYYDEECLKKFEESLSNSDENKSFVSAVRNTTEEATSSGEKPSPASPAAKNTPPLPMAKKTKKKRNAVLLSYLANANKKPESGGDDAATAAIAAEPARATSESAADEEASSDAYVFEGKINFAGIGDSINSSEIEVESQESYLVDDVSDSDDLQASVKALTEVSLGSKSSSASKKSSGRSSSSSNSSKSKNSYHGTSRRNRMLAMSPIPVSNPALGRRSPMIRDVYVPNIVETNFKYNKRDFPPL